MAGVSVTIGGNASGAIAALDGVASKASRIADKIRTGFQERVGHRLLDGLVQAASSLPNAMRGAIDAGGRLADQMARTGAAGEGLVVLERALMNAGMAADSTVKLLGLMQKGIAGLLPRLGLI
jgi:hypothetical protein